MSQSNSVTPFTFLGSISCIPVSKLTSIHPDSALGQTVSLQAGSTRLLSTPSTTTSNSSLVRITNPTRAADATSGEAKDPVKQRKIADRIISPSSQSGSRPKFPTKLFDAVTTCSTGAICWSDDGHSILINYSLFKGDYLNSLFKTANITSFVRQLNLYGFRKGKDCSAESGSRRGGRRGSHEPEFHIFYHPMFVRDRPELVSRITRAAHAASSQTESE